MSFIDDTGRNLFSFVSVSNQTSDMFQLYLEVESKGRKGRVAKNLALLLVWHCFFHSPTQNPKLYSACNLFFILWTRHIEALIEFEQASHSSPLLAIFVSVMGTTCTGFVDITSEIFSLTPIYFSRCGVQVLPVFLNPTLGCYDEKALPWANAAIPNFIFTPAYQL